MGNENIGGFFASLKLIVDSPSFKNGLSQLKKAGEAMKKLGDLAKSAFKFGGMVTGFAGAMSFLENQNYNTANSLGVSVSQMKAFKYAAELAGLSGDDFVKSMDDVQRATEGLTGGKINTGQLAGLQLLGGADLTNKVMAEGDVTEKIKAIFSAAAKSGLPDNLVRDRIADVLGDPGRMLYINLKKSKKSLEEILTDAKKLQMTTDADSEASEKLNKKIRMIKIMSEEAGEVFTAGFAQGLVPNLDLSNMSPETQKEFTANIKTLGESMGTLVGQLAKQIPELMGMAVDVFKALKEMVDSPIIKALFGSKEKGDNSSKLILNKEEKKQVAVGGAIIDSRRAQYREIAGDWTIGGGGKRKDVSYVKQAVADIFADINSGRLSGSDKSISSDQRKMLAGQDTEIITKLYLSLDKDLKVDKQTEQQIRKGYEVLKTGQVPPVVIKK